MKAAIQQQFDKLNESKSDIEDEMKRLQGEYRLLEQMLGEGVTLPAPSEEKPKRLRKVEEDATN